MRRAPARPLLVVLSGGLVVLGACLPWLTTAAGLRGPAALDSGFGQLLAGLGLLVAAGGAVLLWRDTAAGRRAVLVAALPATLLAGWMLAQSEGRYAVLVGEVPALAERGPGGFVALAASLLATGLVLVEHPSQVLRPAGGQVRRTGPGRPAQARTRLR
ncbi:hypothetical protein [Aquipuribacter hungaricus]|uniref:Uncharacterized protein n=1 Tax=Aquipuribacter hungaricus TaxID=545624 RepID=A0ABV7WNU3_9MICO